MRTPTQHRADLRQFSEWSKALKQSSSQMNVEYRIGTEMNQWSADFVASTRDWTDLMSPTSDTEFHVRALREMTGRFARELNLSPNDPAVTERFRALETVVLVRSGHRFDDATRIVKSLPSIATATREATKVSVNRIGDGVRTLANAPVAAGRPTGTGLLGFVGRLRVAALLGQAIEVDGNMLTAMGHLVGGELARPLCQLSQLLAEIRSAYTAIRS